MPTIVCRTRRISCRRPPFYPTQRQPGTPRPSRIATALKKIRSTSHNYSIAIGELTRSLASCHARRRRVCLSWQCRRVPSHSGQTARRRPHLLTSPPIRHLFHCGATRSHRLRKSPLTRHHQCRCGATRNRSSHLTSTASLLRTPVPVPRELWAGVLRGSEGPHAPQRAEQAGAVCSGSWGLSEFFVLVLV